MKRLFFVSLLALLGVFPCLAEVVVLNESLTEAEASTTPYILTINHDKERKTIEIDFKLDAFFLTDNSRTPGTKVCQLPDFVTMAAEGLPMLPEKVLRYNLPTCDSVAVMLSDITTVEVDAEISPAQVALAGGNDQKVFTTVVDYPGYYPTGICQQSDLQFYRGLPVHYFSITPFSYSSRDKKLKVTTAFHAVIEYNEGISDLESHRSFGFKRARAKDMEKVLPEGGWSNLVTTAYPEECTEDFLIISSRGWKNPIDTLAELKSLLGYRVHKFLDWKIPEGKMDSVIDEAYRNLENLTNVLIIGPSPVFEGISFSKFLSKSYCDLHKIRYTGGNYSGYAYREGRGDLLPEFNLGYLYVNTDEELYDFIHKVKKYETEPTTEPSFYNNTFLAGRFEPAGADENYKDYSNIPLETLHEEDQWLIESLEMARPIITEKGLNVNRIYGLHPYMTQNSAWPSAWSTIPEFDKNNSKEDGMKHRMGVFPEYLKFPNFKWNGCKEDLINAFSEGTFLGAYFSHGSCNGWHPLNFFPTDFPQDKLNDRFPLLLSISCSTGDLTWNHSFANWLMKMRQGPIGVIASTEVSYTFANRYLMEGLLKELFPDTYSEGSTYLPELRLGDLLNHAQVYADAKTDKSYSQLQRLTYCCYGDPTVAIHTSVPKRYADPQFILNGNNVYVDLFEDEKEHLSKLHFYEPSTGRVETFDYIGPNYYFKASEDNQEVLVSITGRNRYPYYGKVKDNDGESYFPKFEGKINYVSVISSNEMVLNLTLSSSVLDFKIYYTALGKDGYITGVYDFNEGDKPFIIGLGDDVHGLYELKLISNGILLDTYRGVID